HRLRVVAPGRSPRQTSMLTTFGSARTNSLPRKLGGPTHSPFLLLRASVRRHRSRAMRRTAQISWAFIAGELVDEWPHVERKDRVIGRDRSRWVVPEPSPPSRVR